MLTAAVVEANYDVVFEAQVLFSDLEILMSAVAVTLANLETKRPSHHKIESLFQKIVDIVNTLSELHWCKRGNDVEKAVELVLNDGLDINTPALSNRTPLLWASLSSSGEFIETLIDLGANVNAQRTDDKEAPLTLSSGWNKFMAVYLLFWIVELMLISPVLMAIHHCTQLSAKDFLILPSFWLKREATSTFKIKKEEPHFFLV